jgi:hypothetical protein
MFPSSFTHGSITFLPVLHGRMEFAAVVRAALPPTEHTR